MMDRDDEATQMRYAHAIADYAEAGGAPLLGVNGIVIICHGSSNARAISNAVKIAYEMHAKQIKQRIHDELVLRLGELPHPVGLCRPSRNGHTTDQPLGRRRTAYGARQLLQLLVCLIQQQQQQSGVINPDGEVKQSNEAEQNEGENNVNVIVKAVQGYLDPIALPLFNHLKDAEGENETLKNYIIELKQRIAVYIPVKDDPIDKRLAEFINNYPERQRLKIMFMRESEGVYQFGTKRIAVRVEKDKINIRVGGGYLSIDEFLDQYTPTELERLERKDPLKRFSEKIAVQKTIAGKDIRGESPLRAGNTSPGRAGNVSPSKRGY
jgi:hypothetical protein